MKSNYKGWRLVHNGKKVITLIDATKGESETISPHKIEEYDTEVEAKRRIKELGLKQEDDAEIAREAS